MLKPVAIKTLPDYKLWARYADGVEGEVDLSHFVGKGVFSLWKDYSAYERVSIGSSGEIAWDGEIDLCPDSIYMQITGKAPEDIFPKLNKADIHA